MAYGNPIDVSQASPAGNLPQPVTAPPVSPQQLTPATAPQPTPEKPEPTESEKAMAKKWLAEIADSEKHLKKRFKQMRDDQDFTYKYGIGAQWPGQTEASDEYIANIVQRHISTGVASLYAKNPKAVFKRRIRLEYALWDGSEKAITDALNSLQTSMQSLQPAPPEALALLQDIQDAETTRKQMEKMGKTLEILFNYYMKEGSPTFKASMKQLVRRVKTCGIGYVRPSYQRLMEKKPEQLARLADAMSQLKNLEELQKDLAEGEIEKNDAEMAEIQATIDSLNDDAIVIREGLTFDFPKSTSIIFDKRCTQVVGWIGCGWVAERWYLSPEEIEAIWGCELGKDYTSYDYDSKGDMPVRQEGDGGKDSLACVYMRYDKRTGCIGVVCEGYEGFIEKPHAPDVKIEAFFPWFPLAFNQIEHEQDVIPPSDVTLIRPQQKEKNRAREALRKHRMSNIPRTVHSAGSLEAKDIENLKQAPEYGSSIPLNGLADGQSVTDLLQPFPTAPIDPNFYDTSATERDVEQVIGSQQADMGGGGGNSATQVSVEESSRVSSIDSNIDDLNEHLTEIAKASGQIMLRNMSKQMVVEIVGKGAVWPELSYEDVIKEVWLEVQAGSSGRPNRTKDIADLERLIPILVQIPGASKAVGMRAIELADDTGEMKESYEESLAMGIPSIQALNAQAGSMQPSTGDPATDPNQQGAQGARNAPAAHISSAASQGVKGAQPAYPA